MTATNGKPRTPKHSAADEASSRYPIRWTLFALGLSCAIVSAGAAFMMMLDHFAVMALPGCGVGSGCEQAAKSAWGTVPLINLPTSSVGLAYFLALAIGWIVSRGSVPALFKWIVRIGVLNSFVLLTVIAIKHYVCAYCLSTHAGNIIFWLIVERAELSKRKAFPAVAAASTAFAAALVALGVSEYHQQQLIEALRQREHAETTQRIVEQTSAATQPAHATTEPQQNNPAQAVHSPPGGFTGRWRKGPENAPIRIVLFSDYQCRDCQAIEQQIRTILAARNDVSVSEKHFPLCSDCNKYVGQTMHANACWAARAAETAGMLRGNEGFWQMHQWLFDRGGSFTNPELTAALQQMGYDPKQFTDLMQTDATLALVRADVDEGYSLGLMFTPMIFINGVELRGFIGNPTALTQTVEAVAAKNPSPGSPLQDKPPLAAGKAVGDWSEQAARTLVPKEKDWTIGPADAPIKVCVWGDYQSQYTAELDAAIRAAMKTRRINYTFRQYPLDKSCNPNLQQTFSSAGCWAARAAEAAGNLGGNDAYWKMHDWLLSHQTQFNDDALRAAAPHLGLNADDLLRLKNAPQINAIVAQDVAAGAPYILQGVPTLYVNGKWVARWKLDQTIILDLIFDAAEK